MDSLQEKELIQTYREMDKRCVLLSFSLYGGGDENDLEQRHYLVPTKEMQEKLRKDWEEVNRAVKELTAPSLKFETLKSHFSDFLADVKLGIEGLMDDPSGPFSSIIWGYGDIFRKSRKEPDVKAAQLVSMFDQMDGLWEGTKLWAKDCSQGSIRSSIKMFDGMTEELNWYLERFDTLIPDASEKALKELKASMEKAAENFSAYAKELAGWLAPTKEGTAVQIPDSEKTVKMDEQKYRDLLQYHYGVDLDTIIGWGDREVEKTRNKCFSIAKKLAKDYGEPEPKTMVDINNLLMKYAGPCDSPEEMIERANRYLRRTRALAHEYVRLPKDEDCCCVPIPYRLRDSYPWGGYEGGDASGRPIRGQMFLNVYNYKNVSDGWIKINALHESYPGHHVQYVKRITDPMPETIKIGAKAIAIMEGMCLRTEHAFEFLYGEDPFYPLFAAYRRHHTSVRIKVDLMLFYYGKTIEEAVQTYMDELGFDHVSARGQVQAQENSPGYFTCYYYGMKTICDWEKQYGYSKKDYTELLFSVGNLSLSNFENILKMDPEERRSYLNDFGSLLDKPETFEYEDED